MKGTMETLLILLGGGTIGVVATAIIQWLRFRKKDYSEQGRVEAETKKLEAEAIEIKAKAEVTVAEAALKLAQKISDECEVTRKELENTQGELAKAISRLNDMTGELKTLQHDLTVEKERAAVNQTEIENLRAQLLKAQGK